MAMQALYMLLLRAIVSVVLLVSATAAGSAPSLSYQITDLGFTARALNDRGWVVGNDATGAVLWTPESGITHIGPGVATDINSAGQIVGSLGTAGWVWNPVFGLLSPTWLTRPSVINDLGQIAAQGPSPLNDAFGGYLWDPLSGFTTIINPGSSPQGSTADVSPRDINNRAAVVGAAAAGEPSPFYWDPHLDRAQLLVGADGVRIDAGVAYAINELGQIVGTRICTGAGDFGCDVAYLWDGYTSHAHIIAQGEARDINDAGWVVGGKSLTDSHGGFAFLWGQDFGLLDLNGLIDPTDPLFGQLTINSGTSINNAGWILADNRYLLRGHTALPEPSSYSLGLLGMLCVVVAAKASQKARTSEGTFGRKQQT